MSSLSNSKVGSTDTGPPILGQWSCRRCGSELSNARVAYISPATGIERRAGNRPLRVCTTCRWANAPSHSSDRRLELKRLVRQAPELVDGVLQAHPAEVRDELRKLRSRIIAFLFANVRSSPKDALRTLLLWVGGMYEMRRLVHDAGGELRHDVLAGDIQQLYALLRRLGPLAVFTFDDVYLPSSDFWWSAVIDLVRACQELSELIEEPEVDLRLDGDVVVIVRPPIAAWTYEVNVNLPRSAASYSRLDALASTPAAEINPVEEAERMAFGYSVSDFLNLFGYPNILREYTRETGGPGLRIIDLGPEADTMVRLMARDFTLSLRRVQQYVAPSFFLATGMPTQRSIPQAIEEISEADWLAHAPLLEAAYLHKGQRISAVVTSPHLLDGVRGRAASSVAHRLHNAVLAGRHMKPPVPGQIAALARGFHSAAELEVGREFEAGGMVAVCQLERLDKRPLPCGEIDVIAIGKGLRKRLIVVVCEVKNTDMVFYKDFGGQQAHDLMSRAALQARRKTAWVKANWEKLAPLFPAISTNTRPAVVVPAVATRLTLMPVADAQCVFISSSEIGAITKSILSTEIEAWRPDFLAAQVEAR